MSITITLYVDSGQASTLTQQTVDQYCSFGQNKAVTTNENFSTAASVGDTIIWQGQTNPASNTTIDITQVNQENVPGSHNVFGGNGTLLGAGSPKTVTGTVQAGTGGEDEVYTIFFQVNGTGPNFRIDPKITINPTQTV